MTRRPAPGCGSWFPPAAAIGLGELVKTGGEDLHERYIEHHTCRKAYGSEKTGTWVR